MCSSDNITVKLKTSRSFNNFLDVPNETPRSLRKSISASFLHVPKNFSFASLELDVTSERWWVLTCFVALSAVSSAHYIQYSAISNIITRYYGVSELHVDWTAMVFALAYIILAFPVSKFIDAKNLRASAVTAAICSSLGAWIKTLAATDHSLFHVALVGQSILALSQVFIHSMPSKLAAVWFPPQEESTACCIGVFGHQLGIAIGFLLTPIIVNLDDQQKLDIKNNITITDSGQNFTQLGISDPNSITILERLLIKERLTYFSICLAVMTTVVTIFVVTKYKSQPVKPPSHAQAVQRSIDENVQRMKKTFKERFLKTKSRRNAVGQFEVKELRRKSMYYNRRKSTICSMSVTVNKRYNKQLSCLRRLLFKNYGFVIVLMSTGINSGVTSAITTLLNQLVLNYYPDSAVDAGLLGTLMVLSGAALGPLYGRALDKTQCYCFAAIVVSALSVGATLALTAALVSGSLRLVYTAGGFLGMFLCAFPVLGGELASELTFPEPEGVVSGVLNTVSQIFGIIVTLCMVEIQNSFGDLIANLSCCFLLLIATSILFLCPRDLRRQQTRADLTYAAAVECESRRELESIEKRKKLRIGGNVGGDFDEDEGICV
ncbi:feline leukemia virus subgroup C receptor-related protein 2-like [Ctenocephalides felis]|uniref:feline leukemia virus subgroup C receptor-related protein 2-like n=1 Tax=Ctenocephalides felis TaxID=7515 RepID=UPI000E6E2B78|nr:feline leukemia virus subgroup C receptor-related protein 2-like [Ctenocephalides felis]